MAKDKDDKLSNKEYTRQLRKLQAELCRLKEWGREEGHQVVIVFEGRDTAGKGGVARVLAVLRREGRALAK